MEYLLKSDIILINRKTVQRHGGKFVESSNLLNEEPLDYLVDVVSSSMFGSELYPTIHDKAGLYMFNTISDHIFQDGNKRTGLAAALLFLRFNNYSLKTQLFKVKNASGILLPESGQSPNEILFNFTMSVAKGELNLEECQLWFSQNISSSKY